MQRSDRNINRKHSILLLCLFFMLGLVIGIVLTAQIKTDNHENSESLSKTGILKGIYINTLKYRLAEDGTVLTSRKKEPILDQIEINREKYEKLISSKADKEIYEEYVSSWEKYLLERNEARRIAQNVDDEDALTISEQKISSAFEDSIKTLDRLIAAEDEYTDSSSGYPKKIPREFRLTLNILTIIGIAVLLVLLFNLYAIIKNKLKSFKDRKGNKY